MEVNATGVGHLAERCHDIDALLVHYSTDYVFNGQALEPYEVGHAIDPVNAYGRTKAAGDRAVRESGCLYRIIRTSWLYAPWGNNFVRTMAKLTAEKDQLKVVDDQRGRPTSAQHLVKTSQALIEHGESGTYHATDGGACTWYEFTKEIARQLGHTCDIQPCTTADFPRPAKRPAYSVLDLSKTEAMTGALPDWKDNLKEVLDRMTG
jgi:dTDP-4-dehydrorhamnose reductase